MEIYKNQPDGVPVKEKANGVFYFLDCMNAFINDGLFPADQFKSEAEAIQTAADYEATLYRYEYRDGELINSKVLYQPALL